jgi:hypothetical protein
MPSVPDMQAGLGDESRLAIPASCSYLCQACQAINHSYLSSDKDELVSF